MLFVTRFPFETMRMKFNKRILWRTLAILAIVPLLMLLLLNVPYPFFSTSVSANNLTLYSDRTFDDAAGRHVLDLAAATLAQSPLYSAQQKHQVFVCNAAWRQRLFFCTSTAWPELIIILSRRMFSCVIRSSRKTL